MFAFLLAGAIISFFLAGGFLLAEFLYRHIAEASPALRNFGDRRTRPPNATAHRATEIADFTWLARLDFRLPHPPGSAAAAPQIWRSSWIYFGARPASITAAIISARNLYRHAIDIQYHDRSRCTAPSARRATRSCRIWHCAWFNHRRYKCRRFRFCRLGSQLLVVDLPEKILPQCMHLRWIKG